MATIYLRSTDGNDADDGSTWALAKATLAAALTAAGVGGTVYVSQAHAETQASAMTLTSPGTAASPVLVLCGNDGAAPPTALATTGTVTTTGTSAITFAGCAYYYGLTFNSGTGAVAGSMNFGSANSDNVYESCGFNVVATGGCRHQLGTGTSAYNRFRSCTFTVAAATQASYLDCGRHVFEACTFAATGTVPTTLFTLAGSGVQRPPEAVFLGCNFAALGSGKTLFSLASPTFPASVTLIDCKLGASVTVSSGTIASRNVARFLMVNCDSADTNYRDQFTDFWGTTLTETTIVRTGGASDGTTGKSYKMASTANATFYSPMALPPITLWNETVGSALTATVEVITDNVTLTDAEAWLEVEYLGTSGFPLSLFASDRASDILATPANQTTSSVTWTTTGLATPVKQKLSVAFTPQEKGPIICRVYLAKASTTMYVCPKVDFAAANTTRQYMQGLGAYVNEPLLPAVANARYGVQFGANGTEFTGLIEMPNSSAPTGTQDATSDACVVSGKIYGSPQRTGSRVVGGLATDNVTLAKETGANARSGSGTCAKLTPTNNAAYGYWYFYVPVTASTAFTLSFWHKIASGFSGLVKCSIYDTDQSTLLLTSQTVTLTDDGAYHQYTATQVTPTDTGMCLVRVEVQKDAGDTTEAIYIDDISYA